MQVDELLPYLRENQETLIQEIKGEYKPNPVRRGEIPKEKNGMTTIVERLWGDGFENKIFCSCVFVKNFHHMLWDCENCKKNFTIMFQYKGK